MLRRILALGFVFLFAALPSLAARVGIISDPELQPPADLLTVALSQKANVQVVERAQLERITSERRLTVANSPETGKLLGVDGLVFLEVAGSGTNRSATVRFVAIKQGIVLFSARLGWPPVELERWTAWLADRVSEAALKSTVPSERTVRLSVLNLRSSVTSPAQRLLERELTALLLSRLQQEPNVFVLERRQLNAAAFEKELAESEEKFWTGSSLLDGMIDRDRIDPKRVQLSLRLRAADGAETPIQIVGPRDQLGEVIEQVVGKVLTALKTEKLASWDLSREAAQHLQEATWALRWGLWKEAQAAADAAWALGSRSIDAAATRMLAYAREDYTASLDYWHIDVFSSVRYPSIPPGPEVAESLFESVALLHDFLTANQGAIANEVWWRAACETLDSAGFKLNLFFTRAESRSAAGSRLADSRGICRSIVETILSNPSIQKDYWVANDDKRSPEELQAPFAARLNFFAVIARHAHLFFERPEETAEFYRRLVGGDLFPFVRAELYGANKANSRLGGWTWNDRKRELAVWEGLAEELVTSTNALVQLEGRIMKFTMIPTSDEFMLSEPITVKSRAEMAAFFELNKEALNEAKVYRNLSSSVMFSNRRVSSIFSDSSRLDEDFSRAILARRGKSEMDSAVASFRRIVAERRPLELRALSKLLHHNFEPNEAAELQALATEYQREVVDKSSPREQQRSRGLLKMLENKLQSLTNTTRLNASPKSVASVMPRTDRAVNNPVEPMPAAKREGSVQVDQYWRVPFPSLKDVRGFKGDTHFSQPIVRDGALWLRLQHDVDIVGGKFVGKSRVLKVSLDSMETQEDISTGAALFPNMLNEARGTLKTFEVMGSNLMALNGEDLLIKSNNAPEWRKLASSQDSTIWRVADTIYLLSPESLQRLNVETGQTELLASVRRRPALNVLDEAASLTNAWLALGPEKSLRVIAQGSVYRMNGGEWLREFTLEKAQWIVSGDDILAFEYSAVCNFYFLASTKTKPELLGVLTQSQAEGTPFALGDKPCILTPVNAAFKERIKKGETLNEFELYIFDQPRVRPRRVDVDFDLTKGQSPLAGPFYNRLFITVTDRDLLVGNNRRDGFWRIPRRQIEEKMRP